MGNAALIYGFQYRWSPVTPERSILFRWHMYKVREERERRQASRWTEMLVRSAPVKLEHTKGNRWCLFVVRSSVHGEAV